MSITIVGGGNPSAPTFPVQRSVRLRSSASAYFNRTMTTPTNQKIWTWSGWVKIGAYTTSYDPIFAAGGSGSAYSAIWFNSNSLVIYSYNGATAYWLQTTQVFRDYSGWYHITVAVDTTQATSTNRIKLYINGIQVTAFSTSTYPSLNYNDYINSAVAHYIGQFTPALGSIYFDGYLTEVNFVDGQALTPTSFGAYNNYGVWSPAKYTGTYGTNGFYLNFQDNSAATAAAIGKDSSGNGNNWTPNNISVTAGVTYDSMLDVPTLTSATNANFPVLNVVAGLGNGTYSDGNLAYLNGVAATWKSGVGSMGATSGKYYFEYTIAAVSNSSNFYLGVAGSTYNGFASYLGRTSDSWAFQWNGTSSVKTNNDVSTTVSTAGSISVNNVIQVAIDLGTGSIWWGRNNTWVQGDPSAGTGASYTNLTGTILPGFAVYSNGGDKIAANFGQRPFTYTPPTGFKSLNTYNLPAPTIPNGAAYMAALVSTGNGSLTRTFTGVGFQPDFVWQKDRTSAIDHWLIDSVRGAAKNLQSNTTVAEVTSGGTNGALNQVESDGYSILQGSSTSNNVNKLNDSYVAWCWKANGTPAVVNTSGSIVSTISANTTSGFSIVTWTGNGSTGTIGHGLGVAPKFIITKYRNAVNAWLCYHSSLGAGNRIYLNQTDAAGASATVWNNTSPTSSVFSVGDANTNASGGTYVAYCWAEIPGFSKFGSYTGNASTDGPFIYTGMRPRWVLIKRSDGISNWIIYDTSRNTYNIANSVLFPDSTSAEATGYEIDILSNGFKIRYVGGNPNISAATYIYAAFAESPFNYSLAR